jgi:hypothetical protein
MDNKNKILMLLVSMFLFGCSSHNVKEIEKMIGFAVYGKIKYETKTEQWDNFHGDGFKVIVYKIKDLDYFIQHIKADKFNKFDFNDPNNPLVDWDVMPFITNGKGFYISVFTDREYRLIVIDLINQKLIYNYVSM